MGRPPCCDKSNVKRGLWTPEEDAKILAYVSDHGPGNWTSVPKKAGLRRCGKSCRLRYTNYLRPDLKHDNFTPQEEEMIISLHAAIGSRWSLIAHQLPGRTDNDVKNHWNTKLKKRLLGVGIDPVTHKPISQILTDYENIGGLPKPATRMGTLNRDLKNAFMVKQEPQDGMLPLMMPMLSSEQVFDHKYSLNNNKNHSLELLAQFQAIKLVTDQASNFRFSEGSSTSPSRCCNVLQADPQPPLERDCKLSPIPKTPSSPFCWSEFLLEDAFLQPNQQPQQDWNVLPSAGPSSQEIAGSNNTDVMTSEGAKDMGSSTYNHYTSYAYPNDSAGGCSSSDSSFVDGILHRDSEMSWEFPSLLEEPYY